MPPALRALLALAVLLTACDTVAPGGMMVRYTGPAITEADAWVSNEPVEPAGSTSTVFSYRAGQSVFVSQSVLCGDECSQTTPLRFRGEGTFPTSVEADVLVREFTPERFRETRLDIDGSRSRTGGRRCTAASPTPCLRRAPAPPPSCSGPTCWRLRPNRPRPAGGALAPARPRSRGSGSSS